MLGQTEVFQVLKLWSWPAVQQFKLLVFATALVTGFIRLAVSCILADHQLHSRRPSAESSPTITTIQIPNYPCNNTTQNIDVRFSTVINQGSRGPNGAGRTPMFAHPMVLCLFLSGRFVI
jgi:hypothetical protein